MKREYKVLSRLWRHFDRAPRAYLFCDDASVAGADFFVMERCCGEVVRGVIPESGGTWLLPRIVGWSVAAEIMFTGRKLTAEQCLEYGIVNQVVPAGELMAVVWRLAREIASNAPLAVQATKRMMRMAQAESFEANVHHVYLQLLPLFRSKDFKEGISSFMEKRDPNFRGE